MAKIQEFEKMKSSTVQFLMLIYKHRYTREQIAIMQTVNFLLKCCDNIYHQAIRALRVKMFVLFADFKKKFRGFSKFSKQNFDGGKFLKIRSSLNLLWGHARVHKNIVPNRFSRFNFYWIQSDPIKYSYFPSLIITDF